jgi:hypothetical protein
LDRLTRKWESVKAALQDLCKTFSSDPSFASIQYLKEAYIRALSALIWLEKDFGAWQDFVDVFQKFQRLLLELLAFLDWWTDIHADNKFQSPVCAPMQGVIFEDTWLYENYVHWSVGLFFLSITPCLCSIPSKEVALSPHTLCKVQPMSLHPPLHSLDHWHYLLLI